MNNDITYEYNDITFNYRVAIVIRNGKKVLVQKDDRVDHLTLPGGRCSLLESSVTTALREFKEETGIDTKLKKGIGIIENFFVSKFTGNKVHEILIINELEFADDNFYKKEVIKNIEKKKDKYKHLTYIWVNLSELKNGNFYPKQILDMLDKNEFQHLINN